MVGGMGSDWLVCIWKVPPTPGRLLLVCEGKVGGARQRRQETETRWHRQITGLSRLWLGQSMHVGQMCKSQVYSSEKHGRYTGLKRCGALATRELGSVLQLSRLRSQEDKPQRWT